MNCEISHCVSGDAVLRRSPHRYHALLHPLLKYCEDVTLIHFANDVVLSSDVSQAIREADPGDDMIVAIAHAFTAEALDLLTASNAKAVSLTDFDWTDDDYLATRAPDRGTQ